MKTIKKKNLMFYTSKMQSKLKNNKFARKWNAKFFKYQISLYITFLILVNLTSYAQKNTLIQVTPKSPNVASFDKFIETPVSLASGKIDLDIPLYEFNIGGLKLPIALKYNNNGLRPEEIPSWVGLGWSLFTGGHVSYQQKGLNDFDPAKGLFAHGKAMLDSYFANQMTPSQKQIYFNDVLAGNQDSEYDEYYYSMLSGSGSFNFLSATEARTNPKSDLLVSKTVAGFKIMDDKGNTFLFESQESIISQNSLDISPDFSDNSAYYITKITASNGESAEFTYKPYSLQYNTVSKQMIHSGFIGGNCPSSSGVINYDETLYHATYLLPETIKFPLGSIKFIHSSTPRQDLKLLPGAVGNVSYLSSIEVYNLNNVKMKSYNFDMSYFGNNTRLKLNGIDEVSGLTTSRKWRFEYNDSDLPPFNSSAVDHWGYANNSPTNSTISLPKANYAGMLPNWNNYSPSYFADKTSDSSSSVRGMLKKVTYPTGGYTEFEYESNQFKVNNFNEFNYSKFIELPTDAFSNLIVYGDSWNYSAVTGTFTIPDGEYRLSSFIEKSPDPFYQDSWITISGGDQSSTIELNHLVIYNTTNYKQVVRLKAGTYSYVVHGSEYWDNQLYQTRYLRAWLEILGAKLPLVYKIGGNRIKKVTHKDVVANSTITRKYLYNDSLSNVSFKQIPYYISTMGQYYYPGGEHTYGCISCPGLNYSIHEHSVWPLVGNVIEYGKVSTLTDENGTLGRTDQEFLLSDNEAGSLSEPFIAPTNTSWRAGRILKEFKYDSNSLLKSSVVNRYYADDTGTKINGLRVAAGSVCDALGVIDFRTGLSTLFSEKFNIDSSEDKQYDSENPIINSSNYTYNLANHNNPTSIVNRISKGGNKTTKVLYVFDYANTNIASTSGANGIKWLKINHINAPIEELEIREINGLKYVTGGTLKVYKSSQSVPEEIYEISSVAPILESSFVYSSINGSGAFVKDPNYTLKVLFSRYDDLNHLVEQSQAQGSPTTYIWGYKGQFPVAEIKNASYLQVEAVLNGSTAIANFRNLADPSSSISNFLAPLRISPNLKDAFVTTYTYDLLVGMTSQTDPKGKTTFYEYDEFQRLKNIKNQNKYIVKNYKYGYKDLGGISVPDVFYNVEKSGVFTKSNCGTGQTGSQVTYTVPAGSISSSSQEGANNQAIAMVNANGPNYANINGTCTAINYKVTATSTSTPSWTIVGNLVNKVTNESYLLIAGAASVRSATVPAGQYRLDLSWNTAAEGGKYYLIGLNGNVQTVATNLGSSTSFDIIINGNYSITAQHR